MVYEKNDLISDNNGQPLPLYHGTCCDFDRFTCEFLRSTGVHFGCKVQANYFARGLGSRIFPVHLRAKKVVDVRPSDFGWRYPNQTVFMLRLSGIVSARDSLSLLSVSVNSIDEALSADSVVAGDQAACSAINRGVERLLGERGIDCILYSNKQEPADGMARDAYFVLRPNQIISAITGEELA